MAEGQFIQNPDGSWSMQTALTASKVAEGIADFRLNTEGTLLASAARTTVTTSANQVNYNARGVMIFLNVTAASGTGGLTVRINGIDPVSGVPKGLPTPPTAVTATGNYTYVVYPGVSGGSVTSSTSLPLPRSWSVQIAHGDATSYTYSVGYALIL